MSGTGTGIRIKVKTCSGPLNRFVYTGALSVLISGNKCMNVF